MLKSYKTEIKPTSEQIIKIHKTIGTCRFIYNMYLAYNKEIYEKEKKFVSANDFSKYLNNDFLLQNTDMAWIKDVSTKSVKQAMINGERAFKRFFKKQAEFPKFKKKNKSFVKMYFVMNTLTDIVIERHRIKVPTLGFIRLKEFGYIPLSSNKDIVIKSGTISYRAGHYFVSVLIDCLDGRQQKQISNTGEGLGVDLGIKDMAIVSNDSVYKNINKTSHKIKKLEKRLKREQRSLSRKLEAKKQNTHKSIDINSSIYINNKPTNSYKNIDKNKLRVQKIHYKLSCMREGYNKSIVNDLVRTKPSYISIEDLNVSGMMKNRHLSKAIHKQSFYQFRSFLEMRCNKIDIELRLINRWYPSSKLCSVCGTKNSDLKLSDRIYKCINTDCKLHTEPIDRDLNASYNIRDCKPENYKVICN